MNFDPYIPAFKLYVEAERRPAFPPLSEEAHADLLRTVNSFEKEVLARFLAHYEDLAIAEFALFSLWQNLTVYLLRHGWSGTALMKVGDVIGEDCFTAL